MVRGIGMSKYGLIGHPVSQSVSPSLHRHFVQDMEYELFDLCEDEVEAFLDKRDFCGLNVTIPYKEKVLECLDEVDDAVCKIGACNTIVNRDGKLCGYNTDYLGFLYLLDTSGMDLNGQTVAILGTGGASKAVRYALESFACSVYVVSRNKKNGCLTYGELYEKANLFTYIINTTPVGMKEDGREIVDLSCFKKLVGVVDVIANPYRSPLCIRAHCMGLKYAGGYSMLVRQAYEADLLFTGRVFEFVDMPSCKNLVLIGMPGSGKSSVGKVVSRLLGKRFIDLDGLLEDKIGDLAEFIKTHGEDAFRSVECKVCEEVSMLTDCVIASGGGVVERYCSMVYLMKNGFLVYLDRFDLHMDVSHRPLSDTYEKQVAMYERRRGLYEMYSDAIVGDCGTIDACARRVVALFER